MELKPQKDATAFSLSEKKARAHLGVTRDEIRALRNTHLTEGTHYIRGKQQSVWLNQAGLDALLATISPHPLETEKRAGAPNAHECAPVKAQLLNLLTRRVAQLAQQPVTLLVVNCTMKNPRMILACALGDDCRRPKVTVRVRVNTSVNFIRGMEIPTRLVTGYTDLYELTRKCPRKKGRW